MAERDVEAERGMTARQIGGVLALLGGVYVVMLLVGRLYLIPRLEPGEPAVSLWLWFAACVAVAALAAGQLGGVGPARGLLSGLAFLLGFLVAGPFLVAVFAYYLPDRPIVFGVGLALQLVVLLPPRGALATTWRLALPVGGDLVVSVLAPPEGGAGGRGLVALILALVLLWLLETRAAGRNDASRVA